MIIRARHCAADLSGIIGALPMVNASKVVRSVVLLVAFSILSLGLGVSCQAAAPSLDPIADVTLLSGSPLHIPLLGFDSDSQALSFSATSSNPLVSTFVPEGNRSMRITSNGFGEMVFELFEGRASRATDQIIELATAGEYNGVPFHRVINGFMIQTGDISNGNGTGGSHLGDFDDQFHINLQHNRAGVLSMAKSGDDTNDSQFFITEGPTRHLDFNHSIFGQLIKGESVREAISNVATNASDRPLTEVLMDSVEIFTDIENGVLMLSAPEGTSGTAEVTVTVSDGISSVNQIFNVNITPDPFNGGPFLKDFEKPIFVLEEGVTSTMQLEGIDVEGDPIFYAQDPNLIPAGVTATVDSGTGLVTITPDIGAAGSFNLFVGSRAVTQSNTADTWDTQYLPVLVLPDSLVADFDADADVDGQDFLTWQRGFAAGSAQSTGDATGDSIVNAYDLAAWGFQYGQQSAGLSAVVGQSVPEPSTLAMSLFSALLIGRLFARPYSCC